MDDKIDIKIKFKENGKDFNELISSIFYYYLDKLYKKDGNSDDYDV